MDRSENKILTPPHSSLLFSFLLPISLSFLALLLCSVQGQWLLGRTSHQRDEPRAAHRRLCACKTSLQAASRVPSSSPPVFYRWMRTEPHVGSELWSISSVNVKCLEQMNNEIQTWVAPNDWNALQFIEWEHDSAGIWVEKHFEKVEILLEMN